jgi:hypothetical protein
MSPGDYGTICADWGKGAITTGVRAAMLAIVALSVAVYPVEAGTHKESASEGDRLSPFWGGAISQWTRHIVYWANEREIDPDLVASIVRNESIGHADAEGPSGAVGLMMVMPAETSGMSWRPSAQELKQPNVNIRWGTGMLKEIISDARGDLFRALAAYNGGWEQVHIASTQRFAHKVLSYYVYAIAARHGYNYEESKNWTLVLMTREDGRITSMRAHASEPYALPCFGGAVQFRKLFPNMVSAPRTRVIHFVDDQNHDILVDAWLFIGEPSVAAGETQVSAAPPALLRTGHRP